MLGIRRTKIGEETGTARESEPGERAGQRDQVESRVFDQPSREHRERSREADPKQCACDLPAKRGTQACPAEVAGQVQWIVMLE